MWRLRELIVSSGIQAESSPIAVVIIEEPVHAVRFLWLRCLAGYQLKVHPRSSPLLVVSSSHPFELTCALPHHRPPASCMSQVLNLPPHSVAPQRLVHLYISFLRSVSSPNCSSAPQASSTTDAFGDLVSATIITTASHVHAYLFDCKLAQNSKGVSYD